MIRAILWVLTHPRCAHRNYTTPKAARLPAPAPFWQSAPHAGPLDLCGSCSHTRGVHGDDNPQLTPCRCCNPVNREGRS